MPSIPGRNQNEGVATPEHVPEPLIIFPGDSFHKVPGTSHHKFLNTPPHPRVPRMVSQIELDDRPQEGADENGVVGRATLDIPKEEHEPNRSTSRLCCHCAIYCTTTTSMNFFCKILNSSSILNIVNCFDDICRNYSADNKI